MMSLGHRDSWPHSVLFDIQQYYDGPGTVGDIPRKMEEKRRVAYV